VKAVPVVLGSSVSACVIALTSCFPSAPEDHNDSGAFYRQAVPLLLGRNLRNANEAEFS
jgi:hypothetical protein